MRIPNALLVCGLFACSPPSPDALTGSSPLVPEMLSAADEFGVPAALLASLAYEETQFATAPVARRFEAGPFDLDHQPYAYGPMGIPEFGRTRSIRAAAEALGENEERVKLDPATNVRAAAALLRSLAGDVVPETLTGWRPAVTAFLDAGPAAPNPVFLRVQNGFMHKSAEGSILVAPSEIGEDAEFGESWMGLVGEYPGSTFVAASTSNYTNTSRTAADIDVIVIHTVQGSYAGCISWFQNSSAQVSAHYVVRRSDGAITQMVRHEDRAWHAGNSEYNRRSIGIEHEGFIDASDNYTPAMLESSARLVRWLSDELGVPRDRQHIIGHIEVPRATHTDPGPYFPWDEFMTLVNDGTPVDPPPANEEGVLQGVVYSGTNLDDRVSGATVTLQPGGASATAATDGSWSFRVAPGTYTVRANAPGFQEGSTTRTVAAGASVWGSVSITPAPIANGTLVGIVYDASAGESSRIEGALVEVGATQLTTPSSGLFEIELPQGEHELRVSKAGYQSSVVQRTVAAGRSLWGSVGLVPEGSSTPNHTPALPRLDEPVGGFTTRSINPIFRVGGLSDPESGALRVEIQIFVDPAANTQISAGSVDAGALTQVAWRHPQNDLPRGVRLFWRARAKDGAGLTSPWTGLESFVTPVDGNLPEATQTWVAFAENNVSSNQNPTAPRLLSPLDGVLVAATRPELVAQPASDPDGDELAYQFQIGLDDVFRGIEMTSSLVAAGPTVRFTPVDQLAPGGTYYVRVRAVDGRVFGPWSNSNAFTVADDAARTDDGLPQYHQGLGDDEVPIKIPTKEVVDGGGCDCRSQRATTHPAVGVALILFAVRRRRARSSKW